MYRLLPSILFICSLFLVSCQGSGESDSETGEAAADTSSMAEFAGDEEFQAAHETPMELDFEGRGQMIDYETPDGKNASAYALLPEEETDRYLFVIHEWWGLNEHIKAEAERLYDILDGEVAVLALDIYEGEVATNQEEASQLMESVEQARGEAIVEGAIDYAGENAQIATIGWCFGGGWSLRASIMAGEKGAGCVMYYGMPVQTQEAIQPLEADILGIFARGDDWINEEVVSNFQQLCEQTGKDLEVHWFDAKHAFANPSNPSYDQEAAEKANQLAWGFLKERI